MFNIHIRNKKGCRISDSLSVSKRKLLAEFSKVLDSSYHLRCVRVLVIVPRNYLYLVSIVIDLGNHGLSSIEERTISHTDDIGRNNLLLVVAEGLSSSSLHCSVDAFLGDVLALNNSSKDSSGTCRSRNSLCRTDELAVELRDYEADCLCSTGGVRNDISSTCSCSSEVTLSVRTIEDHLVAGVSVDCAHDTGSDGSVVVKSLSHRSEAVSGAGCSGNDGVILSKSLVVYIVNDSGEVIACGSRDNNLLSTGVDVSLGLSLGYIETCAFENNVNTELTPRKISSVGLSVDGDFLAVNDDSTGSYNGLAIFSIYSGLNINSVMFSPILPQ